MKIKELNNEDFGEVFQKLEELNKALGKLNVDEEISTNSIKEVSFEGSNTPKCRLVRKSKRGPNGELIFYYEIVCDED